MPTAATWTFERAALLPLYHANKAQRMSVALAASLTLTQGQVLAETGTPGVYTPYLGQPAAPAPTTATTGGTVAAGVYGVEISYVNGAGESIASLNGPVTTTGSTSTITIPSPAAYAGATGWYAYVTQANGSTFTRQQTAGSPTAIGTNLTLTAAPTSSGANPLASAPSAAAKCVLEYPCTTDGSGNITLTGEWGLTVPSVSAFMGNSGVAFSIGDLIGLDTPALGALGGSIAQGTLATSGTVVL